MSRAIDRDICWTFYHPTHGWAATTFAFATQPWSPGVEKRTTITSWVQDAMQAKRFSLEEAKEIQTEFGSGIVAAAGETVWEKQCSANGHWMDYAVCPRWRIFKRRRIFEEAVREEMWAMRGALNGLMSVSDFDQMSH